MEIDYCSLLINKWCKTFLASFLRLHSIVDSRAGCDEEEKGKAIGHMFVMGGLLPGKLENEQKPSAIKTRFEASLSSVNTCSQSLPKRGFQLVTI